MFAGKPGDREVLSPGAGAPSPILSEELENAEELFSAYRPSQPAQEEEDSKALLSFKSRLGDNVLYVSAFGLDLVREISDRALVGRGIQLLKAKRGGNLRLWPNSSIFFSQHED